MRNSVAIPTAILFGFLFVLMRVSGVFVFLPMPGIRDSAGPVRAFLSLAATVALFPVWPRVDGMERSVATLTTALASEALLGLTIGLGVAFITETLQMAAQIGGLQAGYGYASTIDPTTQADSGVLLVFAQLVSGLLFFATGLDREILGIFASSLATFPPGTFQLSPGTAETYAKLGSGIFSLGLRLALPVVALLGLVDLSLALLGRLNAQLQILTLAFPIKMLAALVLLAWIAVLYPRLFQGYANHFLSLSRQIVGVR